jgi:hypothetical protein
MFFQSLFVLSESAQFKAPNGGKHEKKSMKMDLTGSFPGPSYMIWGMEQ